MNRTPPEGEVSATIGTPSTDYRPAAEPPSAATLRRKRFSLAWRRLRAWQEILLIGLGYLVYEFVQGSAPVDKDDAAFTNSHDVFSLEQHLHIDVERPVNHFVNARPFLASLSGYYYDTMHYAITPTVLIFLWWKRTQSYSRWRSALVLGSMAALVVFWLWPVAPPRLAIGDITDTLVRRHIFGTVAAPGSGNLVNQYAAMPSLHVGWALWCASAIVFTTKVWWRHLAWLYPTATTLVVIGTGNHYLLDGVGGLAIIAVGMALTRVELTRVESTGSS